MNKRIFYLFLGTCILFMTILTGCTLSPSTKPEEDSILNPREANKIILDKNPTESYLTLTTEEVQAKMNNKDSFMLVIGIPECGACSAYRSTLQAFISETHLTIYYATSDSTLSQLFNYEYVPQTIAIKNGEIIGQLEGKLSLEEFKELVGKYTFGTHIQGITYEEIQEMKNQNKDFVLFIGREDCRDCHFFENSILANYDFKGVLYYFSIRSIRNEAETSEEKAQFYENIKNEFSITWVPVIQVYEGGTRTISQEFLDVEYYSENLTVENHKIEELNQEYKTIEEKKKKFIIVYSALVKSIFEGELI